MYGSGVRIGLPFIAVRHRQILQDLRVALAVCSVAVVGASMPGFVVRRSATTAAPPTSATTT